MSDRIISVSDSITVRSAAAFQAQLLDACEESHGVVLDLASLNEIDLSFLQLVQAARSHLANNGRALRLAQPANAAIAALLERAGFLTDSNPDELDFWFHGDLPK